MELDIITSLRSLVSSPRQGHRWSLLVDVALWSRLHSPLPLISYIHPFPFDLGMPLTLHIYRDPASFLQAIETASPSDGPIDIDTAVMNQTLGGAYDARDTNKTGVWMIITQADIQLGSTLHSETYALTVSRAVNTQQSPILWVSTRNLFLNWLNIRLIMISTNLQKYDMTTQIPLPVGADESIEKFFNDLLTSVVEVTYGKHISQVHSAFGPQVIVHSFLNA